MYYTDTSPSKEHMDVVQRTIRAHKLVAEPLPEHPQEIQHIFQHIAKCNCNEIKTAPIMVSPHWPDRVCFMQPPVEATS